MKGDQIKFLDIGIRYLLLALISLLGLSIFYFIFTPLTIYSSYFLLNLSFEVSLSGTIITIFSEGKIFPIEIIGACVAGSAYSLLAILNFSTPEIRLKQRISMLLIAFISFFIINILRIFLLSLMFVSESAFFDVTHKLFWYAGSTLIVIGIWFTEVKLFKIRKIPFYSDIKYIYKKSRIKR